MIEKKRAECSMSRFERKEFQAKCILRFLLYPLFVAYLLSRFPSIFMANYESSIKYVQFQISISLR